MLNTRLVRGAAGWALLALLPMTDAHAQTINYGALEQLFNEPVTTSATGSPLRSTDAPVAMEIISAADIKRSGATDIPTILSRLAGVDVLTWAAGGAADVSIRGYDQGYSPRLLVLINGRQVYLDHYGYTAWATLPIELSEIRQIEVIKGPNSALFGFNAVGGVVNIITYNPMYDQKSSASLAAGNGDTLNGSVVESFKPSNAFAARVSAGYSRTNQFENVTAAAPATPDTIVNPERRAANLDTLTQIAANTQLRVEASYSRVHQTDVDPLYEYVPDQYTTQSVKASLSSDTSLGLATLSAYTNHADLAYVFTIGPVDWTNTIYVVNAQDLFKIGSASTVRLSLEYRNNELPVQPLGGAKVSYSVYAPSAMWNWAINEKLALTTALRVDRLHVERTGGFPGPTPFIPGLPGLTWPLQDNSLFTRTMSPVSANVGLVYHPSAADTLRFSFARGVQAPTLIEFGGIQAVVPETQMPVAFMGNPQIQPAIIKNYEVDYDHSLAAINGHAGVNVFYQTTDGLVGNPSPSSLIAPPQFTVVPGIGPVPTSLPGVGWTNVGSSKLDGAEFEINGHFRGGYRWGFNYTYTHVTDTAYPGENLLADNVAFDKTTPSSRANLNLGWTDTAFTADGYLRYVSGFQEFLGSGALQPVHPYATLAARIAYALSSTTTLALSGENLLHERQDQTAGLLVERRVLLSVRTSW
jgi:outer membrane receptor for ferrienterochelin and colicins